MEARTKLVGCRGQLAMMRLAVPLAMALAWMGAADAFAQGGRDRAATQPQQRAVSLESRLEFMLRTMRIARDWHIEAPSRSVLIAGAIEGLLARVDPESELYSRDDLRRVTRFMPDGGAGIGLEVRREPPERRRERKGYRVVSARDGSPAARAGLRAGDLITDIDGRPVGELPYLVMMHVMLEGRLGSEVRLTVERSGADQPPEEVVLERGAAFGPEVTLDEVAPGITHIRIAALTEKAAAVAIRSWGAHSGGSAHQSATRGIVLDLRSTAVSGTEGARRLADAFLQSGPVLRTVSRHADGRRQVSATPGDLVEGRPIVVLVDGDTSGAAEMLASALQEGRRARVVGTRTAGRGALRTLIALDRNGSKGLLRLTTERLVTPAGVAIEGKGVTPDILIEQLPASPRCRTRDIEDDANPGVCVPRTIFQDTQLQRAISTLDEPIMAAQQEPATAKP